MRTFRPTARRFGLFTALATVAMVIASLVAFPAASFADPGTGVSVTITVTDPNGQPVSGADSELADTSYDYWGSASGTDSSGSYTFPNVAPGSYTIYVSSPDGVDYVPIQVSFLVADTAMSVTGQFAVGSSISGTMSGVDGGDMTNAEVDVSDSNGNQVTSADVSDSQGDYSVSGLAAGTYTLDFYGPYGSTYISTSETVTLGTGEALTGQDATLQLPPVQASISGTVTGTDNPGVGLSGISIFYYDTAGNWLGTATTNADGTYSIPVSPGTYILDFQDRTGTSYLEQFYANKTTQASATPITVGTTDVTGKDVALVMGGTLSGRITDASTGLGIPNATVYLDPLVGTVAAAVSADADGYYSLTNIPLGSYRVRYDLENSNGQSISYAVQYWNNHATEGASDPVTFASGTNIVNQNVALVPLFTTTTKPTITGTAAVGNVLTASTAAWTPAASFTYQWLRGGVAIAGATSSTYTVTNADGGSKLTVTATGSYAGYTTTSTTSMSTATVTGAVFSTVTPTISGNAVVGQRLTVATGTWSPQPTTFTYSWKRGTTQVGTSSSYTLAAADIGQTITVTVTGSKTSVTSASATSAATATVLAETLTTTPTPTVTGTAVVGQTLQTTVASNAWQPSPVTLAYQWSRDGAPINGATTNSYTLTNADAGTQLTVTVTGTKSGYTTVAETSTATATVTGGTLTATPTPTITGTPTVGEVLDATAGTWSPAPVTLAYQWNRDGTPIDGATDSTYELVAADAASTITVSVTGSENGFANATSTSVATSAIANATFTATPIPTVTGNPIVGDVLSTDAGIWAPGSVTLDYQWERDGVAIGDATSPTYTLTSADDGSSISVTVTGSAAGFTAVSETSVGSPLILGGVITPGTATISGPAQVGGELTATTNGFTPTPDALSYEWSADGTAIAGATDSSYTITAADLGKTITVTVTATRSDYTSATAISGATAAVTVAPTVETSSPVAEQGSTITVTGEGYVASEQYTIVLHSTPVLLGTVTPSANGSFTTQVTIPASTVVGLHHIEILDPAGNVVALVAVTVTAATQVQVLAFTGTTIALGAGGAGLGLLLAGLALVLIRRRRQTI